jgi:hypothetical protein
MFLSVLFNWIVIHRAPDHRRRESVFTSADGAAPEKF